MSNKNVTSSREKRPYNCYNAAMIIDFHTHIFPPEIIHNRERYLVSDPLFSQLYSDPRARLASAEDLIGVMDDQAIDLAVVLNIAWSNPELCRQTNDYILESAARYPRRLTGFGMVVLDNPETALPEIERCLRGGIRGIGEIRPDRRLLEDTTLIKPVIQSILDNKLILLTHSSEPLGHTYAGKGDMTPQVLYPFISAFPGIKLVCAHWGGGLPFYALMPEVKIGLEQVYFDSAASPFLYSPQIYRQTIELAGAGKVLFGSDYPLLKPKRLLAEIDTLGLTEEVKRQILSGNARKLLEM
jgi:predicted TIM-barrel fold metal-dependent hydrolase